MPPIVSRLEYKRVSKSRSVKCAYTLSTLQLVIHSFSSALLVVCSSPTLNHLLPLLNMKVSFVLLSALIALGATSPIEPIKALDRRDPPKSDGVSLLTTINKYRKKYGVHELKWSATVRNNCPSPGMQSSNTYFTDAEPR